MALSDLAEAGLSQAMGRTTEARRPTLLRLTLGHTNAYSTRISALGLALEEGPGLCGTVGDFPAPTAFAVVEGRAREGRKGRFHRESMMRQSETLIE